MSELFVPVPSPVASSVLPAPGLSSFEHGCNARTSQGRAQAARQKGGTRVGAARG